VINLLTAIQTAFQNDSTLMGIFSDGLWLNQAPDEDGGNGPSLPACVVMPIKPVPHYSTSTTTFWEQSQVQFSVYALTDTEVFTALEALKALFVFQPLSMPNGAANLEGRYQGDWIERSDEKVWRGYLLLEFKVQESLPSISMGEFSRAFDSSFE
jgi:hypothetical protein